MSSLHKYVAIFRLSSIHAFKNYKTLIGLSIFLMTCLVIFANLWKIAAAKAGVVDLNPDQLLWYIAFNEWIVVSIPDIQDDMEDHLRSGHLAYLLPRPISYLGATFAEAFGALCVNLFVLGSVAFLFTFWQTGSLPFQPIGMLTAVILGLLAGLLVLIFKMLIGVSAFWLHEVDPIFWFWEKFLFMLGGLMLPLTVYPAWIQTVAHFTPFPAILGERSALALDFNWEDVMTVTASLIGWGLLGLVCLLALYRKGLRILNIEGG